MIEALIKRLKIGDRIAIRTAEATFTGVIDGFEDGCIVLITDAGDIEFIATDLIKGASAQKTLPTPKVETPIPEPQPLPPLPEVVEPVIPQKEEIIVAPPLVETVAKVEQAPEVEAVKTVDIPELHTEIEVKTAYKAGDVIPLELLEKRANKKDKMGKLTEKLNNTLKSLSDLAPVIAPEMEREGKKMVPANGNINAYTSEREFGFITDKSGRDIFFGFSDIIDRNLANSLIGQTKYATIPVLFSAGKNKKGAKAIFIHKPKTVDQIIEIAKEFFHENQYDIALALVGQILDVYPTSFVASQLKEDIEMEQQAAPSPFYFEAKHTHYLRKNYMVASPVAGAELPQMEEKVEEKVEENVGNEEAANEHVASEEAANEEAKNEIVASEEAEIKHE